MIWSELNTVPDRTPIPTISRRRRRNILHCEVFPYWMQRNFREWVRGKYGNPLCQRIDERFAVYFLWKQVALSHTIPDFPKLLQLGTAGIIAEIRRELEEERSIRRRSAIAPGDDPLPGGTRRLREEPVGAGAPRGRGGNGPGAEERARESRGDLRARAGEALRDPRRGGERDVDRLGGPAHGEHQRRPLPRQDGPVAPALLRSGHGEAPDAERARREYVKHAIELVGCFYMRCTDHLPLIPDIGNYLFGGSSSDQAITLGGVTPDGEDAVYDMTYIFLKVTEMLSHPRPQRERALHTRR